MVDENHIAEGRKKKAARGWVPGPRLDQIGPWRGPGGLGRRGSSVWNDGIQLPRLYDPAPGQLAAAPDIQPPSCC